MCEPCGTTHPPLTNHTTLLTNTTQVAESFGITAQEAALGLGCVPIPRGPDRPTKRPDRWRQLFVPTCLLHFYGTHIRELASAHHPSAFQARLTLPHPPLNPSTSQPTRPYDKQIKHFYLPDGPSKLLFYYQSNGAGDAGPKKLTLTDGVTTALAPGADALYLLRTTTKKEGIVEKGCEQDIMCGLIRGNALDSFRTLIGQLYAPVLKQQGRHGWGKAREDSTKEFVRAVSKFGATLTEASHSLLGGVELMKPPSKYLTGGMDLKPSTFVTAADDKAVASDFERVLEDWCDKTEVLLDSGSEEEHGIGGYKRTSADDDGDGPDTELEFWRSRMAKLNSVLQQLKSREARLVLGVCSAGGFGAGRSVALRRWRLIDTRVTDAVNESKDNVKYLTTLEKTLEPLYGDDVSKIYDSIVPLLNSVRMMYAVCRYYHTPARMTRLFSKITNKMIVACRDMLNLNGTAVLWNQDKTALLANLALVIKTKNKYRAEFLSVKNGLKSNPTTRQFDFDEESCFGKFDLFAKRLAKLVDMFSTIEQFRELGLHTAIDGMQPVIKKFFAVVEEMKRKPYDLLSYTANAYDRDFLEFNVQTHDLETKLQEFIDMSFSNITSTEQALNLLRQFQSALKRESLAKDLNDKYAVIFQNYALDLVRNFPNHHVPPP